MPETPHVPAEVAEAMNSPDRQVGRYWMVNPLGAGGMGMVFRAWDEELGRWVALKFLKQVGMDRAREYFLREARLAAGLDHPNIAKIFEFGEHNGTPFMAMQFIDGRTLGDAAKDMDLPRRLEAVRKVAGAVRHAHEGKVIHRDLKPANVMVDARGEVFVMDFGLAKQREVGGEGASVAGSSVVVGTPNYMAPEQAEGKADEQSDVYGVGAILYEMVCGRPPFVGDSMANVLRQVIGQEPVWPRKLAPGTPPDVEAIVLRALEKEKKRRYAGVDQMTDDLTAFLEREPLKHARRPTFSYVLGKKIRKQPLLWGFAAAMVLAIAAGGAFGIYGLVQARSEAEQRVRDVTKERDEKEKERQAAVREAWRAKLETARGLYERSFALEKEGRPQAAAACLLRALEIAPKNRIPEGYDPGPHESAWAEESWIRYRCLDVTRPRERWRMPRAFCIELDRAGKHAFVSTDDGHLLVVDAATGREIRSIKAAAGPISALALVDDGAVVLAGHDDGTVAAWESGTGKELWRAREHLDSVTCAAAAVEAKIAATGSETGEIVVWDVEKGEATRTIPAG
ncbi:MAG: protein kinase domain-containing protein, partial [Planctomycetota bacterium]